MISCEREPAISPGPVAEVSEYLLSPTSLSTDGTIAFSVDSTLYDPSVGGTDVRTSTQTWVLRPQAGASGTDERRFLVTRRDSVGEVVGQQFWQWDTTPEGTGVTNTLDGLTYLSLTTPLQVGSSWDALRFTDAQLVISVEDEPIAVHKDWSATIDSLGEYALPDGSNVEAVWVSHASSENRIELRRVREVYGRGVGLLERRADVLDSQNLEDLPWDTKAERGFSVVIKRLR